MSLGPLRQYIFSLKCPRAQEEKNDVQNEGNAGDDPDSRGIELYCADFGGDIYKSKGKYYQ